MSKKQSGFSLIEVIVAISILAGTLVVFNSIQGSNNLRVRKANLSNTVASLLQRKMVEMEIKYKNRPQEVPEEGENGDFGADYKNFSWKMTSKPFEFPDLSSALISADGGSSEMMITMVKQLAETITKAAKEVTVTIIYKNNNKETEYSASTYIVDYGQLN
jgi:general secretion pathway protein I